MKHLATASGQADLMYKTQLACRPVFAAHTRRTHIDGGHDLSTLKFFIWATQDQARHREDSELLPHRIGRVVHQN